MVKLSVDVDPNAWPYDRLKNKTQKEEQINDRGWPKVRLLSEVFHSYSFRVIVAIFSWEANDFYAAGNLNV
jgi:hypothetical protein